MKPFAHIDIENNGEYVKLLSAVAKLSGLFSDNAVPYINYRVAENIFCKCFNAQNLSRSDTAFDAKIESLGIGLKTFIINSFNKNEKVAEFNSLSRELSQFKGRDLAYKLSVYRNERIDLANRLYNINESLYHIIARRDHELILFETDYGKMNEKNIQSIKESNASIYFEDGVNAYSFNFSKSTLFRRFSLPQKAFHLPIEIIDDPYQLLLNLFDQQVFQNASDKLKRGEDFVILPLYGYKNNKKFVHEKSGLNQWNAAGRTRDFGEVYIPIPINIHHLFPDFFPSRDEQFELIVPTGEILSAKVCQQNSKALMTNPNKALSNWLLRKLFQVNEGELITIDRMNSLGFDSVIIFKESDSRFKIDKAQINNYEDFINST